MLLAALAAAVGLAAGIIVGLSMALVLFAGLRIKLPGLRFRFPHGHRIAPPPVATGSLIEAAVAHALTTSLGAETCSFLRAHLAAALEIARTEGDMPLDPLIIDDLSVAYLSPHVSFGTSSNAAAFFVSADVQLEARFSLSSAFLIGRSRLHPLARVPFSASISPQTLSCSAAAHLKWPSRTTNLPDVTVSFPHAPDCSFDVTVSLGGSAALADDGTGSIAAALQGLVSSALAAITRDLRVDIDLNSALISRLEGNVPNAVLDDVADTAVRQSPLSAGISLSGVPDPGKLFNDILTRPNAPR
jgi:hypothetical protein